MAETTDPPESAPRQGGRRRGRALAAVAVICALGLGGVACGRAETVSLRRAINGADTDLPATGKATVKVRNIFVLGPTPPAVMPAGSDAPFYALITSVRADRLLSVTSPAFAGSRITGGSVPAPGGELVDLRAAGRPLVMLTGSRQALRGGENIDVTLTFERAGRRTVLVPVMPRQDPFDTYPTAALTTGG
ncbi:hypothetical protein [Actinocorallia longicatena]